MWAVVGEGLGILPCGDAAGGAGHDRLPAVGAVGAAMAAIAPPDGIAAMAAPTARTVDQRGPDVRSPRTSIAGSGSLGMRSYLRPLGAVSVTCRAPLDQQRGRGGTGWCSTCRSRWYPYH